MVDIIVIGGGPAGLTAALYAARAGKTVQVIEREATGGQIALSPLVENYPAIPAMAGADFAFQLTEQVEKLGVEIIYGEATAVEPVLMGFAVTVDGEAKAARAVVLATGAAHRHLGLEGEEDLVGMGVSYCAVCDGAFFSGRDVAVVGGGDTALQDALFLANSCHHVTLIHRRDEFRGEQRLVEQVEKRENISILYSHIVEELRSENGELSAIVVKDLKSGESKTMALAGLFAAVGQAPQSAPFAQLVATQGGYYDAGEDCCSNAEGVFVAGDGRVKTVRQLTTAVGDGAVAGLAACKYVDSLS
ncbi:MAG: FAD-dependent oxidoreductase [Oscillospiraceae bacterium]|nr:FAD-dependent oxidoreductase [Oscillospiraceae bacterium]